MSARYSGKPAFVLGFIFYPAMLQLDESAAASLPYKTLRRHSFGAGVYLQDD